MSRCVQFPPLGFVWNGVCGSDLIELLKVRQEKVEAEKESKKAKRSQKKSRKHEHIEHEMQKEEKKRKIQDKNRCGDQHTRKSRVQKLKSCTHVKGFEREQIKLQLKELFENWVPLPTQSQQTEFDNLNWLFDTRVPTRQTLDTTTATFLFSPMANIHARPYTLLY